MSYTITREYAPARAHELGFMGIDYDLHYQDEIDLVTRFADALEYVGHYQGNETPDDMTYQVLDEWLSPWTVDIAQMWIRNGCPDPEDMTGKTITELMTKALYDLGANLLQGVIGPVNRLDMVLDRIDAIYPKTK